MINTRRLLIVGAVICILALLVHQQVRSDSSVAFSWMSARSKPESNGSNYDGKEGASSLNDARSQSKGILLPPRNPNDYRSEYVAMFNKTSSEILAAGNGYELDYASTILFASCMIYESPQEAMAIFPQIEEGYLRLTNQGVKGLAGTQVRQEAALRLVEKCDKIFGDKIIEFIKESYKRTAAMRTPLVQLNTLVTQYGFDLSNKQISDLLQREFKESNLGLLYRNTHNLKSLVFPESEIPDLDIVLSGVKDTVLMCRLGAPCSAGSFEADRLCVEYAICGEDAETAAFNFFKANDLDWTRLDDWARETQTAFAAGDLSVFVSRKKVKP
jgi:hypothetical protein